MEKFIVFSDLHLHNWQYGSSVEDGWNTRLLAQEKALEQIEDFALENNVKHIFFCGDLFHAHQTINAHPLAIAQKVFSHWHALGFKMVFLVGNHDMADKDGKVHALNFLRPYGKVIDQRETFELDGRVMHCLPYTPSDRAEEVSNFCKEAPAESIVLMHQGVKNVSLNSRGFILKDEIFDINDIPDNIFHAYTGHYHSYTQVTPKVTIVGSPMQHTWTDKGEIRGFIYNQDISYHYQLKAPEFVEVDAWSPQSIVKGNFVRYLDFNEPSMMDARDRLMKDGALSVEFVNKEIDTLEMLPPSEEIFNIPKLIKKYIEDNKLDDKRTKVGLDIIEGSIPSADSSS